MVVFQKAAADHKQLTFNRQVYSLAGQLYCLKMHYARPWLNIGPELDYLQLKGQKLMTDPQLVRPCSPRTSLFVRRRKRAHKCIQPPAKLPRKNVHITWGVSHWSIPHDQCCLRWAEKLLKARISTANSIGLESKRPGPVRFTVAAQLITCDPKRDCFYISVLATKTTLPLSFQIRICSPSSSDRSALQENQVLSIKHVYARANVDTSYHLRFFYNYFYQF